MEKKKRVLELEERHIELEKKKWKLTLLVPTATNNFFSDIDGNESKKDKSVKVKVEKTTLSSHKK